LGPPHPAVHRTRDGEEVRGGTRAKWGAEEPCPYFSVTGQLHPALEENSKGQLLVAPAVASHRSGPPTSPARVGSSPVLSSGCAQFSSGATGSAPVHTRKGSAPHACWGARDKRARPLPGLGQACSHLVWGWGSSSSGGKQLAQHTQQTGAGTSVPCERRGYPGGAAGIAQMDVGRRLP